MTPVEVIALIFSIVILAKVAFVMLFEPRSVLKMIKEMFRETALFTVTLLLLIVIVGYFLLIDISIVHILAASLLGMLLCGLVIVQYPREMIRLSKSVLKHKQKALLPLTIMVLIAVWALYAILG